MKSTPTPWTKTGKTAREVAALVDGPGRFKCEMHVPAGTALRFIQTHWVVAELSWIEDKKSIDYSDADIYGITIKESDVADIKEIT